MRFALLVVLALPGCNLDFLGLSSDECASDDDCHGSKICSDGSCVECENDRDCDDGHVCDREGDCVLDDGNEGEGEGDAGEGEGDVGPGEGEGDIGPGEGEGEGEGDVGCGSVTVQGECNGETLSFCDQNNTLQVQDCTSVADGFPAGSRCEEVNPEFGFSCTTPAGDACFFQDPNDSTQSFIVPCQGSLPGCKLVNDATSPNQCVENVGFACSLADAQSTTGSCHGTKFVVGCGSLGSTTATDGQPLFVDCADLSATCDATTSTTNTGCFVSAPGGACIPGLTFCGADPTTATACPTTRVCP